MSPRNLIIFLLLSLLIGWISGLWWGLPLTVRPSWLSNSLFYMLVFPGGLFFLISNLFEQRESADFSSSLANSSTRTLSEQGSVSRSIISSEGLSEHQNQEVSEKILNQFREQEIDEEALINDKIDIEEEDETKSKASLTAHGEQVTQSLTQVQSKTVTSTIHKVEKPEPSPIKEGINKRFRLLSVQNLKELKRNGYLAHKISEKQILSFPIRKKLSKYIFLNYPMLLIEYGICHNLHGNRVNALAKLCREHEISHDLLELACQNSNISSSDLLLYSSQNWPKKLILLRETKVNNFTKTHAEVVLSWPQKLKDLFLDNHISYQEAKSLVSHNFKPFEGMQESTLFAILGPPHYSQTIDQSSEMHSWQKEHHQVICTITDQIVSQINQDSPALIDILDEGVQA